jgi:hypothetical protein
MVRLFAVFFLIACHRPAEPAQARRDAAVVDAPRIDAHIIDATPIDAAIDARPIDAGIHYAREGEVCQTFENRHERPRPCAAGLKCCWLGGWQKSPSVCARACTSQRP